MSAKSVQKQNEPLYAALKSLGLTEGEATLYVLSLEIGPHPISQVAAKMGISRPNIYKLIKTLEDRGLAALPKGGKLKRFSVFSPSLVSELLKKKEKERAEIQNSFTSTLPNLLTKYQRGDLPSSARIYQGRGQYLSALFALPEEAKDSIDFFGSADYFLDLIDRDDQKEYIQERRKRGLKSRILSLPGPNANRMAETDQDEMRETRILAGLDPFKTSFHLSADKIIFWQPKNLLAIRIEDDLIVAMMKSMYEYLWANATRPETSNVK